VYRWVEHTGELELEIEARARDEVFSEAFRALRGLLRSGHTGPAQAHRVELTAPDGAALLADWLAELAYLAETEGFVPERLESLELEEGRLSAWLEGFTGEPPNLVKGATYHRLRLDQADGAWRATVILDV
jgi:SHS2 domain-containing protein